MSISRRKFVQLSSLASASMFVPKFLKAFEHGQLGLGNKILVVVQLSGGNDGLNTVIPIRNDIYYKGRPDLAIAREDAIALTEDIGLNPALKGIKSLYDQGYVSILNGIGYPEPNRSHFRSMDIWQSGSSADEIRNTGWLGRYLDQVHKEYNTHNTLAIEADDSLSLAMKGFDKKAIAIKDINQFHRAAKDPYFSGLTGAHQKEHEEKLTSYLYKTLTETISAADYVYDQSKIYATTQTYPDDALGKRMKTIGSLINSHADTRVYYVSHGSFDTHVDQKKRQERLFTELDNSLTALVADLKQGNTFDDVLIMTFSEFGRRVSQNASKGTDHGTASNMFMIGGKLKKSGIYNPLPDLANLDNGDLKYGIDFKQVYATVLDKWLDADARKILGGRYEKLEFI